MDDRTIARFVRRHGLAKRIASRVPSARGNALVAPPGYHAGYFTSIFSDLLRREWMSKEESFTFETVMSHPDRVELLREALHRQYRTYLYFVCTNSPTINRGRITNRMRRGGHDVDPAKVEARYRRSLSLLPRALALSTRAFLFDNSGRQHRLIAEFEAGKLLRADDDLPQWFVNAVLMTTRTKKRR